MTISQEIFAAHTADGAYEGGAENPAIKSLRLELVALIDQAVANADNGLCHQLLVFANQVGDYARRGRAQAEAASNIANPVLQETRSALVSVKEKLQKETLTTEEKEALLKEIQAKLGE
jgi:hypothetical protein